MDLAGLRQLLTPLGQRALEEALQREPREVDFLAHLSALSRAYPSGLARAALETAILRRLAAEKFPQAGKMFFTREALEQASSSQVSAQRAGRYRGFERILDLGCSIGGDTLALAEAAPVVGVDLDPLRLEMARLNLGSLGQGSEAAFIQADLFHPLPLRLSPRLAIFSDPTRREAGRRIHSVHRYQPPLQVVLGWAEQVPAVGVKISPGVKLDEIEGLDAEVEFISLKGELKEAVLWFGPLKTARRRATLLPGGYSLADEDGRSEQRAPGERRAGLPISEPRRYLYEPDPAILRAGLVRSLGLRMDAAQLDADIAYLTCDRPVNTPFARGYPVEEWLPFNLKRLRAILRERGVERVTVKKRGSPLSPEALIRDLHLKPGSGSSPGERLVFLTHLRGKPIALICLPGI